MSTIPLHVLFKILNSPDADRVCCFLPEASYRGRGLGKEVTRMMMSYGEQPQKIC